MKKKGFKSKWSWRVSEFWVGVGLEEWLTFFWINKFTIFIGFFFTFTVNVGFVCSIWFTIVEGWFKFELSVFVTGKDYFTIFVEWLWFEFSIFESCFYFDISVFSIGFRYSIRFTIFEGSFFFKLSVFVVVFDRSI